MRESRHKINIDRRRECFIKLGLWLVLLLTPLCLQLQRHRSGLGSEAVLTALRPAHPPVGLGPKVVLRVRGWMCDKALYSVCTLPPILRLVPPHLLDMPKLLLEVKHPNSFAHPLETKACSTSAELHC